MTDARTQLLAASLKDLQAQARERASREGCSKTWIAAARKEQLVEYLTTGAVPGGDYGPDFDMSGSKGGTDLAAMIAAAVAPLVEAPKAASVDEAFLAKFVKAAIEEARFPRPVEIKVADKPAVKFERAHPILEDVVTGLACGLHVWMTGPAGSGKTTVASQAAKALELDFSALSVSAQTPVSALLGYMNATGDYVSTAFRKAFEKGGLFCLDEADNGNANVLAVLNAALANGICSFPDGNVRRHENFRLVACANTFGQGANAVYVGRNILDGATLDRFVFLDCLYDEALEREIAGNDDWVTRVQAFRKAAETLGIRAVISPRASIMGAKLLAAGWTRDKVEKALIYKGMAADSVSKLKSNVGKA